MATLRLTKLEREEAERVFNATADLNLGAGIWLRFPRKTKDGAARQPYLIFRYTAPSGVRREMGLGVFQRSNVHDVAERLSQARTEISGYREDLRKAVDPLEKKNAEQNRAKQALNVTRAAAKAERATLARVARDYHERVIEPNRTTKHAAQWIKTLETHVPSDIWHKPIASVTGPELLDAIAKLQATIPETASRVRQRLEKVFNDAEFRGLCTGNPARAIVDKLRESKGRRTKGHFSALAYVKAPAMMVEIRKRKGIAARALEFGMLTAARTGEIIGATWDEFDLDAKTWTVPAGRMKGNELHVVYLTPRAVEIVESMRELGQPYVFPTPELDGKPLSNMAMLTLLRRMDADGETTAHCAGLGRVHRVLECVEVRHSIRSHHDDLTIDPGRPKIERRQLLRKRRHLRGPVVAVASNQTDLSGLDAGEDAVPVELRFVDPRVAGRRSLEQCR